MSQIIIDRRSVRHHYKDKRPDFSYRVMIGIPGHEHSALHVGEFRARKMDVGLLLEKTFEIDHRPIYDDPNHVSDRRNYDQINVVGRNERSKAGETLHKLAQSYAKRLNDKTGLEIMDITTRKST